MKKVKLCGVNSFDILDFCCNYSYQPDYLGFVFYAPSSRNISLELASKFKEKIPKNIKKVAVTVNASLEELQKIIKNLEPDFLQLHGDESDEYILEIKKKFGLPIIKAVSLEAATPLLPAAKLQTSPQGGGYSSSTSPLRGGQNLLRFWERGASYLKKNINYAKNMRKKMTKEENILWQHIKSQQLGCKFRRQQPIGPFIADFYCSEKKIAIELDGSGHLAKKEYDEKRDIFFIEQNITILRFWNNEVTESLDGVLERVYTTLNNPLPKSKILTSPQGGGYSSVSTSPLRGGLQLRCREGGSNKDFLLFDTKCAEYGGSGKKFDWNILKQLNIDKKYFLSGGLNINNLQNATVETDADYFDISSGFESEKGVKDNNKAKEILDFFRKINE